MSKIQYERGTKRRIILNLVLAALVIGAIFGSFHFIEVHTQKKIEREHEELNQNIMKEDNITYNGIEYERNNNVKSYLMIGSDMSDTSSANAQAVENGLTAKMADALYLVVVDDKEETYSILQLDRNTVTSVHVLTADGMDLSTTQAQLCTAYYYGNSKESSSENTVTAVSDLLNGIKIDGYASFTMESIPIINNMVGGVTVTMETDMSDIDENLVKGKEVTLTDEQAYIYVQRRLDADDGTNKARLLRQTGYIDALLAQSKVKAKEDKTFVNSVYHRLDDVMTTNFSGSAFSKLLNSALNYENKGIVTIDGYTKHGTVLNDGIEHEEFYADEVSISETILQLYYKEKE